MSRFDLTRSSPREDLRAFLLQPSFAFAIALIAIAWVATWHTIVTERSALLNANKRDAQNITLVVGQNVDRLASELDHLLLAMRRNYELNHYSVDWPRVVQQEFMVDDTTVQVAVIDAHGMMITSSASPYPDKLVDLSDREHYKAQRDATDDELFISKPVIGRASGQKSVQFTRRLTDAAGRFSGVVVISMDPDHLTRAYSELDMGRGTGLALVGADGVVRGGSGVFSGLLGMKFPRSYLDSAGDWSDDGSMVVARDVGHFPLRVVALARNLDDDAGWKRSRLTYYSAAILFSTLTLLAAAAFAFHRRQHEQRVVHLASHDALTNLANRALFRERLDDIMARPNERRNVALLLIDLDGFKLVNDTYGHVTGDALLHAVARRIDDTLRRGDLLARLGGDEFAILQAVENFEADARALAERLCAILSRPFDVGGATIVVGASIGIASTAHHGIGGTEILRAADLGLYAAKAAGRGTYRFFKDELNRAARQRVEIEAGLRHAIAHDRFEIHYQPIVSIHGGEPLGYEALLRWRREDGSLVPPGEFIPVAEESGLIVQIGEWVLRRACVEIATHPRVRVAVNCSPLQFKRSNVVDIVRRALRDAGLPPERLEIEITESMLIKDDSNITRQLQSLRALGVRISMDDFGTGFSCLSYLEQYPIDTIKIDRSFTAKLTAAGATRAIVRAIIDLANGLSMSTIAEGVETRDQLDALAELGCEEAQGFLFRKPAPAPEAFQSTTKNIDLRAA